MDNLFKKEICDWPSWGAVYRSIDDFRSLIQEIFAREKLAGSDQLSNLTPGTNAVFKAGSYVVKIYAPPESGVNADADCDVEIQAMQRAIRHGIRTPNIVAASRLQDKYVFPYIVMDFIDGQAAGPAFKSFSPARKLLFIQELKLSLSRINTKPAHEIDRPLIRKRAKENARWKPFPDPVKQQIADLVDSCDLSDCVFVHGDLTADNLIVDRHDQVFIIDFADSTAAPACYEYPPIVFDLLGHDREAVRDFIGGMDHDAFIDNLFTGLLLHDFGADFMADIYARHTGKAIHEMKDVREVHRLLCEHY